VVVTNDRKVAQWAAGPFWSGQTWLSPMVIGPGDVAAIVDPEEAKRSLTMAFVSGIVHGQDMIAVRIGLALAHALDASPDDEIAIYWDTFLASIGEPVRKELEMQLRQWEPRSDWGREIFAKGIAEGERLGLAKGRAVALVALLELRGLPVTNAIEQQVMGCTDLALLDRWFRRAATGHPIDEAFAPGPTSLVPGAVRVDARRGFGPGRLV
jgi:hypothetical protein